MFRGISAEVGYCWYGDGCGCGVRVGLLTGAILGTAAGVGAAEEDGVFADGVLLSLRDLGAGGCRYDLRLCRSIMLIAHSCRSTGVRLAACKKASLSYIREWLASYSGKRIRGSIYIRKALSGLDVRRTSSASTCRQSHAGSVGRRHSWAAWERFHEQFAGADPKCPWVQHWHDCLQRSRKSRMGIDPLRAP